MPWHHDAAHTMLERSPLVIFLVPIDPFYPVFLCVACLDLAVGPTTGIQAGRRQRGARIGEPGGIAFVLCRRRSPDKA